MGGKTIVIYDSSTANERNLKEFRKVEVEKVSSDNPELIAKILAKSYNKVLWNVALDWLLRLFNPIVFRKSLHLLLQKY